MVVWKPLKSSVLVCRPEYYDAAKTTHTQPPTLEFDNEFVEVDNA